MFVVAKCGISPFSWSTCPDVGRELETALNERYMRNRNLRAAMNVRADSPLVVWGELWSRAPQIEPRPGLEPLDLFAWTSRRWMRQLCDVPVDTPGPVFVRVAVALLGLFVRPLAAIFLLIPDFDGMFPSYASRFRAAMGMVFSFRTWFTYPGMISLERRWLTRNLFSREIRSKDASVLVIRDVPFLGYVVTIVADGSLRRRLCTRLEAAAAATYWLSPVPDTPRLMDH